MNGDAGGSSSPPRRGHKATAPAVPRALLRRAEAVRRYATTKRLDADGEAVLAAVLDGHRGPALARTLGVSERELTRRLAAFHAACGTSAYEAAIEVISDLAARRRQASEPPGPPKR